MSQLLIPDIREELMARLRDRAARNLRTVEAEAKSILTTALQHSESWAELDAFRDRLATTGRDFGDSTEDLREDRER